MKARIINFSSKEDLSKKHLTQKGKESPSKSTKEIKSLNKISTDREFAKEMFPPDYFMLVE